MQHYTSIIKIRSIEIIPTHRPYLLKKKYHKLEKGFMKIRRSATNDFITRADLDEMYNSDLVELKILDGRHSMLPSLKLVVPN